MAKPKLLCWSDLLCNTGFSKVAMNLYEDLHKDFDVHVLAINYHGLQPYDQSKYFVHPISNDDPLGFNRLPAIANYVKPDIVFLFQDIFHVIPAAKSIRKVLGSNVPIVTYFPIDGSPVSQAWHEINDPKLFNNLITYSKWAIDELKHALPETPDDIGCMYHGVDENIYYPLKKFHIKQVRRERNWQDNFVVLNVNRFQPRKGAHHAFRAFSMFKYGYYIDKDGFWFPRTMSRHPLQHYTMNDVVDEVPGHDDAVYYYHASAADSRIFGPTKACGIFAQAFNNGIKNEDFGTAWQLPPREIMSQPYTEQEVNEIYNAADVNLTLSHGEGCGLSLIEASATGTTSIAPFNSAIPEMIGDTGYLCKNITTFTQPMDNSHMRPIVDEREVVKALEAEYQKWVANDRKKVFNQAALERTQELFKWQDKKDYLRDILLAEVNKKMA